ncbi:MAG: hypothetical protein Q9163_001389 [Psora crenata]
MDDFMTSPPDEIDPYTTLDIPTTATQSEVKTAYRKLALRHHPDKASPDAKESAHVTFQRIAYAYAILSDERRRKRYDITGNTSESLHVEDDDFDWTDFFRAQWKDVVTTTSLEDFKRKYQGSDEETNDILNAYRKMKGNMNKIFEEVMLSNPVDDEERFRALIDDNIKTGKVDAYDNYQLETQVARKRRRQRAEKEAKEAEEHMRRLDDKGKGKKSAGKGKENEIGNLAAMIQQRQQGRAAKNFLNDLEAKYAAPAAKKGGRRKGNEEEPPEEAFQRTAARATKKRKVEVDEADKEDEDDEDEADEEDEDDVDMDEQSAFSEQNDEDDFKPVKGSKKQAAKTKKGKAIGKRRKK